MTRPRILVALAAAIVCVLTLGACTADRLDDGLTLAPPVASAAQPGFVTVCHVAGDGRVVLMVPERTLPLHLSHGDTLGGCPGGLLFPADGDVLPQNNATTQCALHPTRGYGIAIAFDWEEGNDPRGAIAGYHLFAKHVDAINPIVDVIVPGPPFDYIACNSFVADPNLEGWFWMVRTIDAGGAFGAFSTPVDFSYEPCRLADGTACRPG